MSHQSQAGRCSATRVSVRLSARARLTTWRKTAAAGVAAIMFLACHVSLAAAAPCDDTLGMTMTVRHYDTYLLKMPNWSNTKCVDAEETKIVSEPSWPVSASGSFAIDIDGTEYTSNVAIVFEGYIDTPTETSKFFQLNSTDGSRLLIDDKLVVDHDGVHAYSSSGTTKWPLPGPKRFKISVQYFKGATSAGTGLAVSWGDLRELYASPIPAEEFKLSACAASAPPPPNVPNHTGRPSRTLPKACGGKCGRRVRKLPKACRGKCATMKSSRGQHQNRKLPRACGGKCGRPKGKGRKLL